MGHRCPSLTCLQGCPGRSRGRKGRWRGVGPGAWEAGRGRGEGLQKTLKDHKSKRPSQHKHEKDAESA